MDMDDIIRLGFGRGQPDRVRGVLRLPTAACWHLNSRAHSWGQSRAHRQYDDGEEMARVARHDRARNVV